ncbi:ABC transporter ATP-binding protein [Salipiger sp. PrR002]|uniref:ABC transporter ATP-binding protein n=1 Tax=Salipiger sp. PrR002 TaxID=2706489 RepID=UPI0013B9F283|nr:ABC transporter ATP-binding protein [Salipiger sp. PrR002]NDW00448.1 ABC transporter ATP-binding protein [Salipiger sp. PrR002]NDW56406.1 ABC transporter ATP-binding protein [Salipiger sp. PrR004]
MFNRIGGYVTFWKNVLALLRYSDGRLTLLVVIVAVLEAVFGVAMLFAIKVLVGSIAQTGAAEVDVFNQRTMIALGLTLAALTLGKLLASCGTYLRAKQSLLVADVVNEEIQRRTVAADLSFFDSALYYDALERAREVGAQRPAEVISNALTCLRSLILLLGVGVVIVGLDWRILPGVILALVLTLMVQLRSTSMRYQWITQRVQLERKASYLDWLLTSQQYAKEVRLFHLGDTLRLRYRALRDTIRAAQVRIEWVRATREALIALVAGAVFIGSAYLIASSAPDNAGALSALVLLLVAFQRAEAAGRAAVQSLSRLYDDRLFLGQLFRFLDIEPSIKVPAQASALPETLSEGLRLENIQFSYPRSSDAALKGVSLSLPPGKFVALVGGNGSGKSSLIKVMCRLYDAQGGRITLDGEDIRNFDPVDYRSQFGVVFQDFGQYAFTARENIHLGDLSQDPMGPRIEEAATLAGAHDIVTRLPRGYDTMLVRMFDDGEELSGGQWQRVALARAFFPNSRFLILDEPTSATDPSAESALFSNFRDKLGDRAALVISHRLSTIRFADYTYVLDGGRIIEEGRHEDLVAARGSYYRMFKAQMPD